MKKVNPYIKKRRINQLIIVSIQLSLLVLFIAVWELLSKHHIIDNFLFSKPSSIFELLKSYIQNGELWK